MEAIEGLVLELGELHIFEMAHCNLEDFPKMPNLKLLIIHGVQVLHGPKYLSNNLRFLDWSGYPLKYLPSDFQLNELVELHLLHSKIEHLWKGTKVRLLFKYSYATLFLGQITTYSLVI